MRKRKAITLTPALKISPSEHSEQVGFINWFRSQYPEILIFAIPNGEKRAISVAKRLKMEGVVRGVPDLFIPAWNLWIEMKRVSGGRLSTDQKQMISYLENIGHTVIVGKGATDASQHIRKFMEKNA
tara:strand:+ start:106 stop:486 length:381 start_codon:yes stop_codon:yes gene_type:complete